MTDNLALWRAVERTPKEHTKAITGKAYKGTSPKPHYLVMKATETFGPCGIGWGFNVLSERIVDGSEGVKVHIAHIRVWYKWNGERGEVEHMGQTVLAGKNKNGAFTDEDAPKKSITDGLVKALSMIGFAGDIFIGRYDDSKYVAGLEAEQHAPAPSPQQPAPFSPEDSATMRDTMIFALEKCESHAEIFAWREQNLATFPRLTKADKKVVAKAKEIRAGELNQPQSEAAE